MTLVGKQNHPTLPFAHTPPTWSTVEDALQDFHATLQPQRVAMAVVWHFAALFRAHRTALLFHAASDTPARIATVHPEGETRGVAKWFSANQTALRQALAASPEAPWLMLDVPQQTERIYALPLRLPEGQTQATLVLWTDAALPLPEHATTFVPLLTHQAALALRNAQQYNALRAARQQVQTAWDALPDGLLLFDRRGRLQHFNAAAEALFEGALQPYVGQSLLRWLRNADPPRVQQLTGLSPQELRAYLRQCTPDMPHARQREFVQILASEERHLGETCLPVYDAQGHLQGWLVIWRDETEARRQELLRQELNNMIVHDLRNPITSISSSLLMLRELLEEGEDLPLLLEVVETAHSSTAYLLNLVQSILDVARIEQGRMALECESHPLGDCVQEAVRSLASQALRADVTLTADIPPDLPPVWIDEEKIRRVLMNLLDNAIRHTPQGGHVHVSAALSAEHNRIITCIADSGPGVPPEARTRIFEKYAQLHSGASRGYRGVGLGLTFCKLAVEAHGGQIWVDDADLGGAAFCFSLPLTPFV